MQLIPGCSLVASGYLGFGLTSPWDCHVYLLRSGDQALLVDSGCGRDSQAVIGAIRSELGDSTLVGVALTHGHVDHSGGAAGLASEFGIPVFASELAAEWLRAGDENAVGLPRAREAGIYPADQVLRPVADVRSPESIRVGDLVVRALPTPGHSPDHVVYAVELGSGLAVFSGDLVFAQGRIAFQEEGSRSDLYEKSVRGVADLRPEHLFPGHGAVALHRGWAHVDAAVAAWDRGLQPSGLVA